VGSCVEHNPISFGSIVKHMCESVQELNQNWVISIVTNMLK